MYLWIIYNANVGYQWGIMCIVYYVDIYVRLLSKVFFKCQDWKV